MPDRGRFVLVGFKRLDGMNLDAMKKLLLKRLTGEELYGLLMKGYLVPGMLWLKPCTNVQLICRWEDPWRSQMMGLIHYGVINVRTWWPLN